MLAGNLDSRAVKLHASTSITLRAYRVLAGSSRQAYHFKNPTFFLEGTGNSAIILLPRVLKRPKDIESDRPDMFSGGLVYLFHAREIQMTHCNGEGQ